MSSTVTEEMVASTIAKTRSLPVVAQSLSCIPEKFLPGLDPEWAVLWTEHGSKVNPANSVTIEEFRKSPEKYSFIYPTSKGPEVFQTRDWKVPVSCPVGEIICRVYTPKGTGPFPVHLNFHGGGWTLGSLISEQSWCKHVCNNVQMVVVDVDYRLAPEYRFPTAIYDCWDSVKWVIVNSKSLNVNPESVSIGGLSSGGHMAAVLSHFARDEGLKLKLQLLTVPATDMRYCPVEGSMDVSACEYESAIWCADAPWGPVERESWFLNYFIGTDPESRERILNDWRMTPVLAPNFTDLATAFIVTAEFDVERDEGEYYGRLLEKAGNRVWTKRYLGVPHAFAHYNCPERGLSKAQEYIRDTCSVLKRVHAEQSLDDK